MKVYLDNAATTPMDKEVISAMLPFMEKHFGNPSSIHSFGREVRTALENSRKNIARLLNVSPSEIFFTSGGTEANNTAICCSIRDLGITHAITSPIEHHAVLHTLEAMKNIRLSFVKLHPGGHVDLEHLEELLKSNERSFVSLMHANNETGNLLSLKKAGEICAKYNAVFHSDTVQTMGHYALDLKQMNVHFVSCSGHKFHGPKGCGFLYISSNVKIKPFITGGAQERNMRGGTENVTGIIGLGKAFEIAHRDMAQQHEYIQGLKDYMKQKLETSIPGISYNGDSGGLYTVLNVSFPPSPIGEMLLFKLDIAGIAASGGSACSSGSEIGSHVLKALGTDPKRPAVRFSFSKFNTREEVDYCVEKLEALFAEKAKV